MAHRLLPLFSLIAHRFSPPLEGAGVGHPELVEGLPSGTVENRSLQPLLQKLAEKVDIVGTVPRTVRKTARSGTARVVALA